MTLTIFSNQADIWSLGVCLFAMLCGYLPFEDPDTGALYKKILAGTYKVASFVSSEAQDLIAAMLTTDPSRRIGAGAICEHPWFVNRCAAPLPPGPPLTLQPEKLGAVMEVVVDESPLAEIEAFGFSRDYCVECLRARKRNHITPT